VTVRPTAWVCDRLTAAMAGSNLVEIMVVRLLCLLCVVQVAACATVYHPFGGVLPAACD
jgi:hypothetical protein